MPKVGRKSFKYSKTGKAAAKRYARKTGKTVKSRKKY
jgi:butyrate kinase